MVERYLSSNNQQPMHRTSTPLLTLLAILFSTAALSQTVKMTYFSRIPTPEWAGEFHGPVLAKDNAGNLYQAATVHQGTSSGDFILAKYNGFGLQQWSVLWSSPGFEDDEVTAIATDPQGDVIVTGNTMVPGALGGPYTEAIVLKYDPTGTLLWAIQSGFGPTLTASTCVTTDITGNILIGGAIANTTADSADFFVAKIDNSGNLLWTATYDGTAGRFDQVAAIATDASANVYITGESMGQIDFRLRSGVTEIIPDGFDYETIKYNPTGQLLWANRYATTGADIPTAMTLDAAGNIYVTGSSNNSGTTVCYSTAGTQQWVLRSTTAQNYTSIALDPSGSVVTAGYDINAGALNYVLTKSTAAGTLTWSLNAAAGPYFPLNYGPYLALAIDRQSSIYIAGEAITSGGDSAQNLNFLTLKYSSSGGSEWSQIFNGYDDAADVPSSIAIIDPSSPNPFLYATVYVSGFTDMDIDGGVSDGLALVTYTQTYTIKIFSTDSSAVTGKNESLDNSTPAATLSNYPNPFHGTTNIAYTLSHDSHVTLQVFTASGNLITTLADDNETAGPHNLPLSSGRLAVGIYLYRIVATSPQGNFITTNKMIIQ
jgi:hypothetical protein